MPSAGASDGSGIFSKFGPREAFPEFAMKLFILFLNFVKHYFWAFCFYSAQEQFWRRRSRAARRIAVQPKSFRSSWVRGSTWSFLERILRPSVEDTSCEPVKTRLYIDHCRRLYDLVFGWPFLNHSRIPINQPE